MGHLLPLLLPADLLCFRRWFETPKDERKIDGNDRSGNVKANSPIDKVCQYTTKDKTKGEAQWLPSTHACERHVPAIASESAGDDAGSAGQTEGDGDTSQCSKDDYLGGISRQGAANDKDGLQHGSSKIHGSCANGVGDRSRYQKCTTTSESLNGRRPARCISAALKAGDNWTRGMQYHSITLSLKSRSLASVGRITVTKPFSIAETPVTIVMDAMIMADLLFEVTGATDIRDSARRRSLPPCRLSAVRPLSASFR